MTYTGSLNVVIYGVEHYPTNYSSNFINPWTVQVRTTPKFNIGDRIVYYTYLLQSKKLAIHKIIDITDTAYVIEYQYEGKDTFEIEFAMQDNYMEFDECSDKYPDLFLSAEINGPDKNIWKTD